MFPTSPLTRRSLLIGAGVTAASMSLAACQSPSVGNPSTAPGTAGGGASAAGGKLTLMLLGPTDTTTTHVRDNVIPAFKAAEGYDVELQTSDWGSAFQKITTGAASNSLPDVFIIGGIWTAPLASKDVLLDITDRLDAWEDKEQFYPGMLADCEYEGRMYAVPFAHDTRVGLYRQDLLDAAGVTDIPTTWDEFRAAAEAVKAQGGVQSPIDWALDQSIGLQQSFAQLFLQAGGEYFDSAGKATFNSPAGKQALEFMVGTFTDGLADYNVVWPGNGPRPLASGLSAMTFNGTQVTANVKANAADVADKITVGPALKPDAGAEALSVAWINKFAIAKSTQDADGAWKLTQFLTGKEQLSKIDELYGNLPPRKDLANEPWLSEADKGLLEAAQNSTSQPRHPKMMQLGAAVKELLEPAIRGQAGIEETLAAIDAKIDSLEA
ncbi:MAG: sugar ABC transporter substrate-binding protein [Propionibacteriaceae bacterium]|nr:sugar ABC transporter substrate-binding protein [Propionibacteriaceae bacterium]